MRFHACKIAVIQFVLLAGLLGGASAEATPILSIVPSSPNVTAGQDFFLNVEIQGVTDLFAFDIGIAIGDTTVAQFDGTNNDPSDGDNDPTAEGPFLLDGGANATFYFDDVLASDSVIAVNTGLGCCGVSGDGVLFSVFFKAVSQGSTDISFGAVNLRDSNDDPIIPTQLNSATVGIGPEVVPEPAALLLLGSGLGALGWRRWTRLRAEHSESARVNVPVR